MPVRVQTQDFDVGSEISCLHKSCQITGAVVSFVGYVRDLSDNVAISQLTLEHYPEMTEKALENIIQQAKSRWPIFDALVIHRVGTLKVCEQIVLVAVSAAHRGDAFKACEFIMDYLKTEAPFWKKETSSKGEFWVEAKDSDELAREKWQ
ncbi:MAG TPA: molybdopterin synthase catalytic subunit MoaE [Methylotenera sp.]|nr:molybdopterin synthase catalytic subunit MoaE [Methylotenera sp.]HPN01872.1 molybdopterin synthase catalytic subunit MoaE [Methylotenera sp.]